MSEAFKRILSRDAGPFWQLVKYGVVGLLATAVQTVVFYLLATTALKCLTADDFTVRWFGFAQASDVSNFVRALRFALATGIGFTVANVFCWLLNRRIVFRPGRHRWHVEFLLFYAGASLATLVALGLSSLMIGTFGLMTSYAVVLEVVSSFFINFFLRKFVIFKE